MFPITSFPRVAVRRTILAVLILAWIVLPFSAVGQSRMTRGVIGEGTNWAIRWQVNDSGKPGPTVLVVGGVHGNEPAGFRAAEQIKDWPIVRGKLIVIPQVNRLGLAANLRWIPGHRNNRKLRDLNRNFPQKGIPDAKTEIAKGIWEFVQKQKPDWVFDLHEGFDFNRLNAKSVGSSVIGFPKEADFGKLVVQAVNQGIEPQRHFTLLAKSGPAVGSLARACHEQLGARSFIFETTFKEQPVSTRTRQHRLMVSNALQRIGMISTHCVDRMVGSKTGKITIGVFDGPGANESKVFKVLDAEEKLVGFHLGAADIKPDVLDQFDVLLFPGGSGSKQGKAIGAAGRDLIREFADDGGGVIGICAGAYLCSSHYSWSLHLMNARVYNQMVEIPGKGRKSMWYRGPATSVDVEIHEQGAPIVGLGGQVKVRYQNGPILSPDDKPAVPPYRVLAFFRSENGIYEVQKGTMIGRPAVVESTYGKGRVVAISPHFESTAGRESVILNVANHVRKKRTD